MRDNTLHVRIEPDGNGSFRLIKNGLLVPGDLHGLVAYMAGEADVALAMHPRPDTLDWVHEAGAPIRLELVLDGYVEVKSPPGVVSPPSPDWTVPQAGLDEWDTPPPSEEPAHIKRQLDFMAPLPDGSPPGVGS